MKRGVAVVVLGLFSLASGCASPAHYVKKEPDGSGGIVAVPDASDSWPNYNMRAAKALIEQHVGQNYEIVDRYQLVKGRMIRNGQQMDTDQAQGRKLTTGLVSGQDVTEFCLVYRRRSGPVVPDQPYGGVPGSGVMQTGGQGPAPGVIPSVLPGGGATGTTSYFSTGSRPAVGGSDCQH